MEKKRKFKILIKETLYKTIVLDADSEEKAEENALSGSFSEEQLIKSEVIDGEVVRTKEI
jgi:hypothetical protein